MFYHDIFGNILQNIQGNPANENVQGGQPKNSFGNVGTDIFGNETGE